MFSENGLSLRKAPRSNAEKIGSIPYGQRVTIHSTSKKSIEIEGLRGKWTRVSWQGKTGWVFDAYLADLPLPEKCSTLQNYAARHFGIPIGKRTWTRRAPPSGHGIEATLYRDGREYRRLSGYEFHGEELLLPRASLYAGYVIIRRCGAIKSDRFRLRGNKYETPTTKEYLNHGLVRPSKRGIVIHIGYWS